MAPGLRWSDTEMVACVRAYADMWRAQQHGVATLKADKLKALGKEPLSNRTLGSIRMRMGNIAAVMAAAGRPLLQGYVPLNNIGPPSVAIITAVLHEEGLL